MNLTVKYFGLLAEETGCTQELLAFDGDTIADLVTQLKAKHPGLASKEFQVAQNLEIMSMDNTVVHSEIALLPPFSGG